MFILLTACEGTWSHKEEKLLKDTVSQMGSQERAACFGQRSATEWVEVAGGSSAGRNGAFYYDLCQ